LDRFERTFSVTTDPCEHDITNILDSTAGWESIALRRLRVQAPPAKAVAQWDRASEWPQGQFSRQHFVEPLSLAGRIMANKSLTTKKNALLIRQQYGMNPAVCNFLLGVTKPIEMYDSPNFRMSAIELF
jgi:hypothetical protein